jgi:hypothetical protein
MSLLYTTVFGQQLDQKVTLREAIQLLESRDLINIGELAELAISKKSGVAKCTKNHPDIDLVSGVQIKHARSAAKSNTHRSAYISIRRSGRLHQSTILAVVTETLTGKLYYFRFPTDSFQHKRGSTIGIPFDGAGRPKLKNRWWKYRVDSFDQLCRRARRP